MSEVVNLASWIALANKLLRLGYEIAGSAGPEVQRNDDHAGDIRLMAVSLTARSLSNMRGTLAMVESKLVVEARVLARCILENQFWIAGFANDPDKFRQTMIKDDRNRKGKKVRRYSRQVSFPTRLKRDCDSGCAPIRSGGRRNRFAPKQVAREAKNGDAYVFYDLLSTDAHPTVFALNRYVTSRDGQEVTGIDLDPNPSEMELDETVGLACFGLVNVIVCGCRILWSDAAERVDELARRLWSPSNITSMNHHQIAFGHRHTWLIRKILGQFGDQILYRSRTVRNCGVVLNIIGCEMFHDIWVPVDERADQCA